jgi:DNA-binding response OmpR family regulator
MKSRAILIVEDDPALGEVLVEALALHGHQPSLARSAAEALELLSGRHKFEVVILDIHLGTIWGDELVDQARTRGHRVPPVLIHSAQPFPDLRLLAEKIDASDILQKPCSTARILAAIETAIANDDSAII